MLFAAIALSLAGPPVQTGAEPRLLAHVELRSLPMLERCVTSLYEDLGFGDVYAMQPRFESLRALFPADVAERPCALALILAPDRTVRVVPLAPASTAERALAAPHARGPDVELHAFAEDAARSGQWLARADAGDAVVRVSVDVRVLEEAWGDGVAGAAAALRTALRVQSMRGIAAAVLGDAIGLLERGSCALVTWDRVEFGATPGIERIECEATLVPRAGSAAERWLATWSPAPAPRARVAFPGADLEGVVGACEADVDELFCGGAPEALDAWTGGADAFARGGGVFAAAAAGPRFALAAHDGAQPTIDGAAPAEWITVGARCLSPPTPGEVVTGDCLYVRFKPAPWLARANARDAAVEIRGRVADGALRLSASVDRTALASIVPVVRFP